MKTSTKLNIIAVVVVIVTTIAEIAFIVAGNGLGTGLCLVGGIIIGASFRMVAEMMDIFEGDDKKLKNEGKETNQDKGSRQNQVTQVSPHEICVICGEPVPEGRQVCGMCEIGQAFLDKKKE